MKREAAPAHRQEMKPLPAAVYPAAPEALFLDRSQFLAQNGGY